MAGCAAALFSSGNGAERHSLPKAGRRGAPEGASNARRRKRSRPLTEEQRSLMEKGPPPGGTLLLTPAKPHFLFFAFHSHRNLSGFFNRLLAAPGAERPDAENN